MIAEVIINSTVKKLDKIFDYIIPSELEDKVDIGDRVLVPFANMKKLEEGFIVGIKSSSNFATKEIKSAEIGVSKENLQFAKLMAKRYFCNTCDCIKLMLPPGSINKQIEKRVKTKKGNFAYLKKEIEEIEFAIETGKIKSEKHIRILNFLKENEGVLLSDLEILTDTSVSIIKTLEKNGYLEISEEVIERNPFVNKKIESDKPLVLNAEQLLAVNKVDEKIENNQFTEFLLYGVTGSRKNRDIFATNTKSLRQRKDSNSISTRNITYSSNGK